jgi:3-hydroxybutyryl-CoA dehydratase
VKNELNGDDYEDFKPGMSATFAKTIIEADIVVFAAVSGDNNAVHINEELAQTTRFKGRIAHGMRTASVISAAVAGRLPGPGTVYLSQNLRFCVRDTARVPHSNDYDAALGVHTVS